MTETVRIALPKGVWTQLSAGQKNVSAQKEAFGGRTRLYVGATAPTGSVGMAVGDSAVSLSDLGATDNVYMLAEEDINAVWVIRG